MKHPQGSELRNHMMIKNRAEQRGRITSLTLLAMLLLMHARIQLAFWDVSTQ